MENETFIESSGYFQNKHEQFTLGTSTDFKNLVLILRPKR